jgi:hypothetical protein
MPYFLQKQLRAPLREVADEIVLSSSKGNGLLLSEHELLPHNYQNNSDIN